LRFSGACRFAGIWRSAGPSTATSRADAHNPRRAQKLVSSLEVPQSMEVPHLRNPRLRFSNPESVTQNLSFLFPLLHEQIYRSLPLEALSPKRASSSHTDSLPREHYFSTSNGRG
jgi:hypothetical protein